jgi:hypothetical protein
LGKTKTSSSGEQAVDGCPSFTDLWFSSLAVIKLDPYPVTLRQRKAPEPCPAGYIQSYPNEVGNPGRSIARFDRSATEEPEYEAFFQPVSQTETFQI